MGRAIDRVGRLLARYLERPVAGYEPFTPSDPAALTASLRPGDKVRTLQSASPTTMPPGCAVAARVGSQLPEAGWS